MWSGSCVCSNKHQGYVFSTTITSMSCSALQHFDLVEEKELAPLSELIEQFLAGKMNSIR